MIRIIIDQVQKDQLLKSAGEVELCDESGRVIAKATTVASDFADPWSLFPGLTPEEIEQRAAEPGSRYSTEEVKKFLSNPEMRPW